MNCLNRLSFVAVLILFGCGSKVQSGLQHKLGFLHGTPYYKINVKETEVLDVAFVQPRGTFEKAGFKQGDILVDFGSINQFYDLLEKSRGKNIDIRVVTWDSVLPLKQHFIQIFQLKCH